MITDCHIHIQPLEMFKPAALELMKKKRPNYDQIVECCSSPKAFLKYLDQAGIDRAVLINYVAPEVIGFTSGVNQFIADYTKENPKRLISCGGLHPRNSTNILADVEQLLRLGFRMIKIHPPHQLLYPNEYLSGVTELEIIYRAAEANGVPVMFHTGTSVFPRARNVFAGPPPERPAAVSRARPRAGDRRRRAPARDVGAPRSHVRLRSRSPHPARRSGGRRGGCRGIPPQGLLQYFPRLEEVASKTLFGTDWPGPGVPEIKKNLDDFRGLPLSDETKRQILSTTALNIWPE